MAESICARVREATGWTDRRIADLLGVSRPLVNAYIGGRAPEYLNGVQRARLLSEIAAMRRRLDDLAIWFELLG